jgi:hypothetical protein
MGRSKVPGLRKRGRIWHIDKQIRGYGSLCESTGSHDLEEAQRYLAKRCEEIRQASVYGIRPTRTFREAATKYLLEHQSKASIDMDVVLPAARPLHRRPSPGPGMTHLNRFVRRG